MNEGVVRDDVPLFPSERAFLVHFVKERAVAPGEWRGRVEHVVTGRSTKFNSSQDILAFMEEVLGS